MQRPEEMFPEYSRSKAYTLAVASKLVYEEVNVIKHELEKDGFNVHRSFLPMAYRVCYPLFYMQSSSCIKRSSQI